MVLRSAPDGKLSVGERRGFLLRVALLCFGALILLASLALFFYSATLDGGWSYYIWFGPPSQWIAIGLLGVYIVTFAPEAVEVAGGGVVVGTPVGVVAQVGMGGGHRPPPERRGGEERLRGADVERGTPSPGWSHEGVTAPEGVQLTELTATEVPAAAAAGLAPDPDQLPWAPAPSDPSTIAAPPAPDPPDPDPGPDPESGGVFPPRSSAYRAVTARDEAPSGEEGAER